MFRSYDSTMTSNLDDLDDLEESRVDDHVSLTSGFGFGFEFGYGFRSSGFDYGYGWCFIYLNYTI